MKQLRVVKSSLSGSLSPPPSKSQTMRALLFAYLAKGESHITHPLPSPDTEAMCRALAACGASVKREGAKFTIQGIEGRPKAPKAPLNAGNSGLVYRFMAAMGALQDQSPFVISGDYSIQNYRPIAPLLSAISALGGKASKKGPNIFIKGPLKRGSVEIEGSDSQPVSALLIACAFSEGPFDVVVKNLGERPWLDLTISWLKHFKLPIEEISQGHFYLPGGASIDGFDYRVPADFSSTAFPLAAALTTRSPLEINNLSFDDAQGDKKLVDMLISMGASIEKKRESLIVDGQKSLEGGEVDISPFVDALPILAVLGCFMKRPLKIVNGYICRFKECDRIRAIALELRKMGAKIEEHREGLTIFPSPLKGAHLLSHRDHRIALSLAVAALGAQDESHIASWECTEKSYPHFHQELQKLGAQLCLI